MEVIMKGIPKVIHYCWFGKKPLPELALKCINSWKKYFPDYEIKQWNEENFDVNCIPYVREAYECQKYAFVSDYARFWILYKYGGIYFDTDVEVLQSFAPILERGSYMGCECDGGNSEKNAVNPGLGIAVAPGLGIVKTILDYYESIHFVKDNGEIDTDTVVSKTTRILKQYGMKDIPGIQEIAGIVIYPKIYFCPDEEARKSGKYDKRTFSAHHYTASWRDEKFNKKLKNPIWRYFFFMLGKSSCLMKKIIGEERWKRLRDQYLKKLYNFARGIK